MFATGSRDGCIKVWDVRCTGTVDESEVYCQKAIATIERAHSIQGPSFSQAKPKKTSAIGAVTGVQFINSRTIASAGATDGLIKLWDFRKFTANSKAQELEKSALKATRPHGLSSLAIDSGRDFLYAPSTDNTIHEYSVHFLGEPTRTFKAPGFSVENFFIRASISPDGNFLASGSFDGGVYVWQISSSGASTEIWSQQPQIVLKGHDKEVGSISWCKQDFNQLATCSEDESVRIWNVTDRDLIPSDECEPQFKSRRGFAHIGTVHPPDEKSKDDAVAVRKRRRSVRSLPGTPERSLPSNQEERNTTEKENVAPLPKQPEKGNPGLISSYFEGFEVQSHDWSTGAALSEDKEEAETTPSANIACTSTTLPSTSSGQTDRTESKLSSGQSSLRRISSSAGPRKNSSRSTGTAIVPSASNRHKGSSTTRAPKRVRTLESFFGKENDEACSKSVSTDAEQSSNPAASAKPSEMTNMERRKEFQYLPPTPGATSPIEPTPVEESIAIASSAGPFSAEGLREEDKETESSTALQVEEPASVFLPEELDDMLKSSPPKDLEVEPQAESSGKGQPCARQEKDYLFENKENLLPIELAVASLFCELEGCASASSSDKNLRRADPHDEAGFSTTAKTNATEKLTVNHPKEKEPPLPELLLVGPSLRRSRSASVGLGKPRLWESPKSKIELPALARTNSELERRRSFGVERQCGNK
ncbi:WD40-repeat-containing domain protein [Zopfochytrium polystomum]|nr:WD40-repeat-containing domain protein [Zopfochytrium polystomum]